MFPKDFWYVMCESAEAVDKPLARMILGQPLVAYRTDKGEPVVLRDVCPHRGMPLSLGKVEGDSIRCGYHGIRVRYSPRTRSCSRRSSAASRATRITAR